MDINTILLKSPRGRDEIRTREHGLSRLARRLLIIADGQHTVTQMAADLGYGPRDHELHDTLQALVDGKYLHVSDEKDMRRRTASEGNGWHAVVC